MPAKVEGKWTIGNASVEFKQKFQDIDGTYTTADGMTYRLTNTNLRGDQISFSAGAATYTGRVSGPIMQGTMRPRPDAQGTSWSANLVK